MSAALTLAVILGTVAALWWSPVMHRPFELDELTMVERYTWAGVESSGELRRLRRVSDFYELPTPGLRHLAIGVYRYNRRGLITFIGETRQQAEPIISALLDGRRQFGGEVVVFRPLPGPPALSAVRQ